MAILVDNDTKLVVQGLTGREGTFHGMRNRAYGTDLVAGVTPGKGGTNVEGVPIFDTVSEAVEATGANTAMTFVPPAFAADAILEAAAAGIGVIVCITEGIPAHDEARVYNYLRHTSDAALVGPNCPGVLSPGKANVGIMPPEITTEGRVGVVSRSGTLTYQAVHELSLRGIGQSTCVGIGGDPVPGSSFVDILRMFQDDPETDAMVMIGEIGGSAEEEAHRRRRSRLRGVSEVSSSNSGLDVISRSSSVTTEWAVSLPSRPRVNWTALRAAARWLTNAVRIANCLRR